MLPEVGTRAKGRRLLKAQLHVHVEMDPGKPVT